MQNIYGSSPVFGDNFFGRQEFVKQLVGILLSGNSFLLLGLRRIGKSSTVKEAIQQIKKQNEKVITIELNCQTYKSIEDFYKNLNLALPLSWRAQMRKALKESKRIPTRLIDFITDHIEEVDFEYIGSIKLRNDAISFSNPLIEEITRFFSKQQQQIILFVDELPFLFEHISKKDESTTVLEIESILTILRSWREVGVAQAICGSLNLHVQMERLEISRKLLAGVNTQVLPRFTHGEAFGLIEALAKSKKVELNEEDIEEMLNLLSDFIPQVIQYFFFIVNMHWDGNRETLAQLYEKHVYQYIITDFEYQFNERLSKFPINQMPIVRQILNMISKKDAVLESEILKEVKAENTYGVLLQLLNHELIVPNNDQTYSFALNVIAQWWKKKMI